MSPLEPQRRDAWNAEATEQSVVTAGSGPRRLCVELLRGAPTRASGRVRGLMLALVLGALAPVALHAQNDVKSIKPGMTEADVRAAWGEPLTARKAGTMTYLYYRNDCMRTCGTHDVVFLENGQVVDAVVRDSHRGYDGVASSPRDRKPEATIRP